MCFLPTTLLTCPDIMQCRLRGSTSDSLSPSQCALLRSGRGRVGRMNVPVVVMDILRSMLVVDYRKRPTAREVFGSEELRRLK
jgi:hypothetical protein